MAPAVFDATTADIETVRTPGLGPNAVFRATGRVLKFDGWLAVQGGAAALAAAHIEAPPRTAKKATRRSEGEAEAGAARGAQAVPAKACTVRGQCHQASEAENRRRKARRCCP